MTNQPVLSKGGQSAEPCPTDSSPCYLLLDCARLIRRRFSGQLAGSGLSEPQWRVLAFVARSEGLSQTELAALLGLHKVALGEHIARLQQMAYLQRAADPADRRARRIYLAPAGRPLAEHMAQRFRGSMERVLGADRQQLHQRLQRPLQTLTRQLCPPETLQALDRLTLETSLHLVGVLARLLGRKLDGMLKPHGLSRLQWQVLIGVYARPGTSQTELSQALGINKAALGQILDVLEAAAWLRRSADSEDRRIKRLAVEDSARYRVRDILRDCACLDRLIESALTGPALRQLVSTLSRMRRQLSEV